MHTVGQQRVTEHALPDKTGALISPLRTVIVDLDVQPEAVSAQAIKGMFDDKGQRLSPKTPSGGREHDAPQLDVGVGIAQARQQHEAREPILLNQRKVRLVGIGQCSPMLRT